MARRFKTIRKPEKSLFAKPLQFLAPCTLLIQKAKTDWGNKNKKQHPNKIWELPHARLHGCARKHAIARTFALLSWDRKNALETAAVFFRSPCIPRAVKALFKICAPHFHFPLPFRVEPYCPPYWSRGPLSKREGSYEVNLINQTPKKRTLIIVVKIPFGWWYGYLETSVLEHLH